MNIKVNSWNYMKIDWNMSNKKRIWPSYINRLITTNGNNYPDVLANYDNIQCIKNADSKVIWWSLLIESNSKSLLYFSVSNLFQVCSNFAQIFYAWICVSYVYFIASCFPYLYFRFFPAYCSGPVLGWKHAFLPIVFGPLD